MSAWIDTVNTWGEAWLNWAGASALQSSLLIVVVLALARWLRGRVNPVWIHGLWMLVLVKLALPPTATSPMSLGYWLPRPNLVVLAESHNEALTRVTVGVSTMPSLSVVWTDRGMSEGPGDVSVDGDGLTWRGGLAGLGLVGTLGVLGWVGRAGGRVRREIGRSRLADAEWTAVAAECATRLGLRRVPEVRFTGWLPSPAVCGLRRPVILIPEMLAERLEPEARRDVLLHEMAHVRRGDLWAGTIEILLLAVYWWHPLVWVTRARLRRLREEIADAVVVVEGQREAGRYAETLLRVAKAAVGRPLLTVGLMGIVESGGTLRRRVKVLLDDCPRRAPRLGWSGWLGWVVVALMVLPMGEGPRRVVAAVAGPAGSTNKSPRVMTLGFPVEPSFREATPEDLEMFRVMRQIRSRSFQVHGADFSYQPGHADSTSTNPLRTDFYGVQQRRFPSYQVKLDEPPDGATWPMRDVDPSSLFGAPHATGFETGIGDPVDVRQNGTKNGPVKLPSVAAGVPPAVEPGVSPGGPGATMAPPAESSVPTNLVTRVWKLNMRVFVDGLEQVGGKPLGDSPEVWNLALGELLKAAGVLFEPPAAMLLEARKGLLMVRADQPGIEAVEKLVEVLSAVPPMVQIEAHFVSFSHPKLKELFPRGEGQWEILSAEKFRQVWQQIAQWVPAKHRSPAPRVTTLVGRQAAVEQYEKLMIRHPGEDADREESFGASLDVTPEMGEDDAQLVLPLRVTQKEFLGYEGEEPRRPNIVVSEARAKPRLRSGETAMLSLVKPKTATFRLGEHESTPVPDERASTSSQVTVAFVTATFIDPAGNPLPHAEAK